MKKRFVATVMALVCAMALAGCGEENQTAVENTTSSGTENDTTVSEDEGDKSLANINPDDYVVSLGNYKGLTLEAKMNVVTDDDIELAINQLLYNNVSLEAVEGRALQTGDIANINYEGKLDGVAFQGGTDDSEEGYDLEIGSGAFIPGFEDSIIGMNIGETRDIDVTFPEQYPAADLAGKAVVFTVKLNGIKERVLPELTDEFVVAQEIEGITTVDQFKEYTRKVLGDRAQSIYDSELENSAMEALISVCEFNDNLPKARYQYYYDNMLGNDEDLALDYGLDFDTFIVTYYGFGTKDDYYAKLDEVVTKAVQVDLAAMAILKAEGQEVDDTVLDKDIADNYATYQCTSVDDFKEKYDVEEYRAYLINTKAMDIVKANATVVEPKEETAE